MKSWHIATICAATIFVAVIVSIILRPEAGTDGGSAAEPGGAAAVEHDPNVIRQAPRVSVADLVNMLRGAGEESNRAKLASMVQQLNEKEVQELIDFLAEKGSGQEREVLRTPALARWAKFDPQAALEYTMSNATQRERTRALPGIVSAWAGEDPQEAFQWYLEHRKPGSSAKQRELLAPIFGAQAAKNLDAAVTNLSLLADLDEQRLAMSGILSRMLNDTHRRGLLEALQRLEDQELRQRTQQQLLTQWAMRDGRSAARWLEGQRTLDGPQAAILEQSIASMWMQSEPAVAAEWIMSRSSNADRSRRIAQVAGAWAYRDAAGAAQWLGQFEPGPSLDDARQSLAFGMQEQDPNGALDWAKGITDSTKRNETVEQLIRQWHQSDPEAAQRALPGSGLSQERVRKTLEEIAPTPAPD